MSLTDGSVGFEWLVIKAKNFSHVVEIGMLNDESPLRVVHPVIEVSDCYLCPPVIPVVDLHMPVHPYRAHVVRALQQRCIIFSRSVYSNYTKKLGVAPASLGI